jgi:hypothetical protein
MSLFMLLLSGWLCHSSKLTNLAKLVKNQIIFQTVGTLIAIEFDVHPTDLGQIQLVLTVQHLLQVSSVSLHCTLKLN